MAALQQQGYSVLCVCEDVSVPLVVDLRSRSQQQQTLGVTSALSLAGPQAKVGESECTPSSYVPIRDCFRLLGSSVD